MSRCLKYWIRLLQMEEYRYPKQCRIMLKKLDETGKITWASRIIDLLFQIGLAWIAQDV